MQQRAWKNCIINITDVILVGVSSIVVFGLLRMLYDNELTNITCGTFRGLHKLKML